MRQMDLLAEDVTVGSHVRLDRRKTRLGLSMPLPGGRGEIVAVHEDEHGPYYVIRLDRSGRLRMARRQHVTAIGGRSVTRARR